MIGKVQVSRLKKRFMKKWSREREKKIYRETHSYDQMLLLQSMLPTISIKHD